VIHVGAATETEMKEKKARVEDAMHATRAAVEEGIVPGGGVAFLRAIPALEKLKLEEDEQIGLNIVKRALEEPLRLIASNAGHEGAIVVGKVRESAKTNYGFNAETEEYTDMISAGILGSGKSDALSAPERCINRRADAHDGSSDRRTSKPRSGSRDPGWRR
jgi:chaperonin GroEL